MSCDEPISDSSTFDRRGSRGYLQFPFLSGQDFPRNDSGHSDYRHAANDDHASRDDAHERAENHAIDDSRAQPTTNADAHHDDHRRARDHYYRYAERSSSDRGQRELHLRHPFGQCVGDQDQDHEGFHRRYQRRGEPSFSFHRPVRDTHPPAGGVTGPECQHPKRLRRELHVRWFRAVAAVCSYAVGTLMTISESTLSYRRIFHHEEHVMGTVVTIDLFNEVAAPRWMLTPIVKEAIDVLHAADAMFSTWKDTSYITRIRRDELSLDDAPVEISIVLERCRKARDISFGWFDPWAMPGGVDPTGLVKGWAAQQSLNVLKRTGVSGALVNAAGDIASFGGPQYGQKFRIGVTDPADLQRLACVVETPGAIATSGSYERGAHLIDPHSGLPTTRAASATVVGTDLSLADALATALVVGGKPALTMFKELNDYEGLVIEDDGTFHMTPQFPIAK